MTIETSWEYSNEKNIIVYDQMAIEPEPMSSIESAVKLPDENYSIHFNHDSELIKGMMILLWYEWYETDMK